MACQVVSLPFTLGILDLHTDVIGTSVIPDELKPHMRQRFFTFFEEDDLQVRETRIHVRVAV